MSRILTRLVPAAAVVLFMGGCHGPGDPPLDEFGDFATYCGSVPSDAVLAFGAGLTRNSSAESVMVTDVELIDPVGMDLIGAKVSRIDDAEPAELVGILDGWPPETGKDPDFASEPDLLGAVIPPDDNGSSAFTVGVRAQPGGTSGPLRVTYRSGDPAWQWQGRIGFRAAHHC